jgi:hypothetical protein
MSFSGICKNMMRKLFPVTLFTTLLFATAVHAQTFNMSMETNLPAWNPCVLPLCQPGGSGIPTKVLIAETGTKWPPNSLELSVTGPEWTNFLAWNKVGATTATTLASDFWVYLPSIITNDTYQALEYDIFEFLHPYEFTWGSQCVIGGQWQIWDQLHGQWLNTTRACQMNIAGWYHVQWWVHRVNGDTGCDGYPCMYYDMLGVNGIYAQFETSEPAGLLPANWSNDSGLNFQLDINGAQKSATITEYIQKVNFTELGN